MDIVVIGEQHLIELFSFMGIAGYAVTDSDDLEVTLKTVVKEPNIGVVLVSEKLAEGASAVLSRYVSRAGLPIVIDIPDDMDREVNEDDIKMFRESLGLNV